MQRQSDRQPSSAEEALEKLLYYNVDHRRNIPKITNKKSTKCSLQNSRYLQELGFCPGWVEGRQIEKLVNDILRTLFPLGF